MCEREKEKVLQKQKFDMVCNVQVLIQHDLLCQSCFNISLYNI